MDIIIQVYGVYSRGKLKFVYDMGFTLVINGIKNFENSSFEITVSEATNHDVDDNFEV